jgi:hypothetical protein
MVNASGWFAHHRTPEISNLAWSDCALIALALKEYMKTQEPVHASDAASIDPAVTAPSCNLDMRKARFPE